MAAERAFRLEVPLDASGVKNFKPDRAVKVVAYDAAGHAHEASARFNEKGHARAIIQFSGPPGRLRVVVGPENATAEQLKGLQTIGVDVSSRQWGDKTELVLAPIVISSFYWWWWWWWCREYKITGRVVCADGSPVPGAEVCAYNVDWWWWWFSEQKVGCATTDATGSFEIDFVRCCGWWPWWWWLERDWQLNPVLVDRIAALLRQVPTLRGLPLPSPQPSLDVFQQLLAQSGPGAPPNVPAVQGFARAGSASAIDPSQLEALRSQLMQRLPAAAAEFEPIRLWPWWPWEPWWDCDPNIIFKATQNCGGQNTVIISETLFDARDDIPTTLNVTLVANDQACCVVNCNDPNQCPQGDCILLSEICDDSVGSIGGNVGAPASPVGLLNPGTPTIYGDRPYSGTVGIQGAVGDTVDYYEFQYSTTGFGGPWLPLPAPTVGGFDRQVFVAPSSWPYVPFPATPISDGITTHLVFETMSHYEANHGPQLWTAYCYFTLMGLVTQGNLANGTYYLQAVGWTRPGYTGDLTARRILPLCGTDSPNGVVVTIDNQTTNTSGPTDFYGQPCGTGTVHVCTVQPETAILQVSIVKSGGTTILGPCGTVCIDGTDLLQIDFVAYDPDAFLAYYTLNLTYGASLITDLLSLGGTLTPSPIPPLWAPAASQVGPDYGSALVEGATSPSWAGGAIRLTVSAAKAFPITCAYELQLYAFKRTIGCSACGDDHSFWNQYNLSEQSFTVIVPPAGQTCETMSPCPPAGEG